MLPKAHYAASSTKPFSRVLLMTRNKVVTPGLACSPRRTMKTICLPFPSPLARRHGPRVLSILTEAHTLQPWETLLNPASTRGDAATYGLYPCA